MAEMPVERGARTGLVAQVHTADAPGANEPRIGTIEWHSVMAALCATSYRGSVGLEYRLSGETWSLLQFTRAHMTSAV
jgi:hydroxypyruvate isomerase